MKQAEISEAIIQLTKRPTIKVETPETCSFTISGKNDATSVEGYPIITNEASDFAFAKKIVGVQKTRYFVKMNSSGKILNPIGLYSESTHNKQLRHTGAAEWQYAEVNEKVFTNYLNFLKSRNNAWLLNAEREIF